MVTALDIVPKPVSQAGIIRRRVTSGFLPEIGGNRGKRDCEDRVQISKTDREAEHPPDILAGISDPGRDERDDDQRNEEFHETAEQDPEGFRDGDDPADIQPAKDDADDEADQKSRNKAELHGSFPC